MSVHIRKDGQVFVKYYIKDDAGKRKEKREYFGQGLEAEKRAEKRDEELKALGRISGYTRRDSKTIPLFSEIADEYMKSKANDWPETSTNNTFYKLTGVILPTLGNLQANQITHYRLDQYVKKRLKTVKKTTIHRELSDIIAILNFATARDIIPYNPVAGYKKPKRDDAIIRPPDPDEIRAILRKAADHLKRALLLNYYTGLRPGYAELYQLTWHDVSWKDNTLLIRSARKGGPIKRSVSLHPVLLEYLKQWHDEDGRNKHPFIIHYNGRPVKSLKTSFRAAKRRAGITRKLRPYDFRHAAITQMILNGDLKAASEIAGHSSVEMTIRQYEHITSKIKKETVEGIEKIEF